MIFKPCKPLSCAVMFALFSGSVAAEQLNIQSASDWGGSHSSYPASKAIDGDTNWSSRWAAQNAPVNLVLDLGSVQNVQDVKIAWGKGEEQTYKFEIRALADESSSTWDKVYYGESGGNTSDFESYDVQDVQARWVRIKVFSNSAESVWTNITEVQIHGNEGQDFGLDPNAPPSGNFDLLDWYVSIPVDEGDGYATSIKENTLAAGYEDEFFYTGSDGGLVFYTPVEGVTTSSGTKYVRTELREMLRRGDTSYSTSGKDNNWAFSSIPSSEQAAFGGIDGTLNATLAVNHVTTTTSNTEQVGRIVIGQIHAEKNEPIRLYYHKLPNNDKGAIYFAHETSQSTGGDETWYNLLGNMVTSDGDLNSLSNPSDGIALDETFSYSIVVEGDKLITTISQNGTELAAKEVDMNNSGYDDADNYMYFKAGIYLQDNTSNDSDYAQVTFYQIDNSHN
ncbi:polysaccharide lyase family 7 protein [Vibrio pelagius]|uniref:Polysaccharide lyase family 7 protein n=1 Tax=Vibrio pelagius TaxID=28169 RepID=A0ABY5G320_VIBPE|nr:polysaccharide lyase family 7 protein [Vibrio pelagius]USW90870.1 alginate lyase IV [Vibrio pelagius]UTT84544.1 polysaccharide lyase family 7 protein [Vibrio pelagius]